MLPFNAAKNGKSGQESVAAESSREIPPKAKAQEAKRISVDDGAGETSEATPPKKMKGPTAKVIQNVIEVLVTGEHKCTLVDGCAYKQTSLNVANFKRHMKKLHPQEYSDLPFEDKPTTAELAPKKDGCVTTHMSKVTFLSALVKLVTVDGLPFISMSWEGMQELIHPYCEAFNLVINNQNITDYVQRTAIEIDKVLREELKPRMFSLKIDAASKMHRSVLGINCQFIDEKGVQVKRTLAMQELTERHTGSYLKTVVFETLARFECSFDQVHAVTIDNGKNVVKMTDLMTIESVEFWDLTKDDLESTENVNDHHTSTTEGDISTAEGDTSTIGGDDQDDGTEEDLDEEVEAALDDLEDVVDGHSIVGVRCGAHTLQLVVADATKPHKIVLKSLNKIVNSLHNAQYKPFFDLADMRYPPLPVPTRWNSTFTMLRSVFQQKEKFQRLGQQFPDLSFDANWQFIEAYVHAFEPLYDATIAIQREQCTLGDFFGQWLTVTGKLEMMPSNMFRDAILHSMKSREKRLLNNYAVQAALYVDPRFSFNGSSLFGKHQKENIIAYLMEVSKKVERLRAASSAVQTSTTESEPATAPPKDGFSLNCYVSSRLGPGTSKASPEVSLEQKLRSIQYQAKVDADQKGFCVVDYWAKKRWEEKKIWRVMQVILSAAATQCTVERDFNQYNLVFTKTRNRLSPENLQNVLKIKTNRQLVCKALASALSDV